MPILSVNRLSAILGFPRAEIDAVADSVESFYLPRVLRTANKQRPIDIPIGNLAVLQRRIATKIFRDFTPHFSSFGGVRGRSALDNAKAHVSRRFLAKLDIRNFYPSVHYAWVQRFFEQRHGCSPPVASILRRLTTFKKGLPQGTCTSPALADQLMQAVDHRITSAVKPHGVVYTRFVDDITLSANFSLRKLLPLIVKILHDKGLHVHPQKTAFFSPDKERVVTGYACRTRVGVPNEYIAGVVTQLRQAKEYSIGKGEAPPYGKDSYWGVIQYIRRTDAKVATHLKVLFDAVDWTVLEPLELPGRRPRIETPFVK